MHLYKFIGGKTTDSIRTLEKKIQKKRKLIKTKEDKAILDEAEHILLDYHRRRCYDFKVYLPLISQEKFLAIESSVSKSKMKNNDGKTYVHTYQYQKERRKKYH